jgi:hypothetical protein
MSLSDSRGRTHWLQACTELHRELLSRQALLTGFAGLMLALMLPTLCLAVLDERLWREVPIWAKPLKFMASTVLFAACTAWFVGWLPQPVRHSRGVKVLAWTVVLTSSFEVGYISLQAALGEGSHHNVSDPLHAGLFGLMALAAVLLTATQLVLAFLIARHGSDRSSVLTQSIVSGLVLTFLLATASGFLLGGLQPPAGQGLPWLGWHLQGADARPAHFLGVHAQQFLPALGWALHRYQVPQARRCLWVGIGVYLLLWAALILLALH